MKKLKKFVLTNNSQLMGSQEMKLVSGGVDDKVKCVCSCNYSIGTWTTYCEVDNLGKDFSSSYCTGNGYARCGSL